MSGLKIIGIVLACCAAVEILKMYVDAVVRAEEKKRK